MGNQMTAELLVKFKALQLQADTEANKKVKNRNGVVDADNKKEIKIFQDFVTKQYKEGKINDADYATLMGADFSAKPAQAPATEEAAAPAEEAKVEEAKAEEAPVATKVNEELTGKEKRQAKRYNKECLDAVTREINYYIETKSSTTIANLMDALNDKMPSEDYKAALNEVQAVVDFVQNRGFNSKLQVEALKNDIKNNKDFSDFQRSLADEMFKLAEREQITKETNILVKIYEEVKAENGSQQNFSAYRNAVQSKMDSKGYTGNSYFSVDLLDKIMTDEVEKWAEKEMRALNYNNTSATKKNEVIDVILNKLPETDKFARKIVSKMKDSARSTSNKINYNENYDNKLGSLSKENLRKELGEDLFHKLNGKYLDTVKENDTYNLRVLADIIRGAIGEDWEMNTYADKKRSEMQAAIDGLKLEIQHGNITEADLNKLKKLCKIEDAPKDHSFKTAVTDNLVNNAITSSALGTLGTVNAEAVAKATITSIGVAEAGAKVSIGWWGAGIAAGSFALDVLTNLIIGKNDDEETCFKFERADGLSIDEYTDDVLLTEEKNEDKAKGIILLAKTYHKRYGENWNTEFMNDLTKAAGNDRVLNCKEFRDAYPALMEKLSAPAEVEKEKTEPTVEENEDQITTKENVTHDWKAGHSWQAIVLAFYPEAFEGKTYDEIKKMIKPFVDEFRRSQNIGFKQGLPVNQTVEFKPITVNGVTYNPVQATKDDIKKCTSNDWFGYGSDYFTGNWNIKTEGNAKVNGQKRYTSTRTSDGATNSGNDQKATQDALIPGAQENVRTTVTITDVDGTQRKVTVEPENKEE